MSGWRVGFFLLEQSLVVTPEIKTTSWDGSCNKVFLWYMAIFYLHSFVCVRVHVHVENKDKGKEDEVCMCLEAYRATEPIKKN